jgi:uncharacterized protein
MDGFTLSHIFLLCGFSLFAGFIDAIVGGGGLVQLPALFVILPQIAIPTLLGINKFSSIAGTIVAMGQYAQKVEIDWPIILIGAIAAFGGSFLGANVTNLLNPAILRPVVLVILIFVAIYTFYRKDFGDIHKPKLYGNVRIVAIILLGLGLGFYDGFLGPGTGSFLNFGFISFFGFSFLVATASSKVINFATNFSALLYFISSDHLIYQIAIPMSVFNIFGAILGTKLAIAKGTAFIRYLFLIVVTVLILKMGYDILSPYFSARPS